MASLSRTRRSQVTNYWPGFVDALSSLLLCIIFLLSLFMLTQFFLGQEIQGKDTAMTKLNSQIAQLTEMLQLERSNNTDLQGNLATLQATLATTTDQRDKLQGQIATLGTGTSDKDAQIADLGQRLNLALAQRVQDLSQYRSDFFGRLRKILEGRTDVQVVGDRFVFQSEVLFPPGDATISDQGKAALDKLAGAVKQLQSEIPPDINWVLRIDGHTDKRPINTPEFPSNWELSAARAIAVTKYLAANGVSEQHLVAAGFGDSRPIDPGDTDAAYAKN